MTEAGGPTTQSGIHYQNSIAALYLGRMLDTQQRPDSQQVLEVRVEAPEHVDDTVVTFVDQHRVFIQAKENVASSSEAWKKLWADFDSQFRRADFQKNQDRLLLHIGNWRNEHDDLKEICNRAFTSLDVTEWHNRLTQRQHQLLAKISPCLLSEGLTDEVILQLMKHVDVEIIPLQIMQRDYVPYWMPNCNKPKTEFFRLLRDRIGGTSRIRGTFTAPQLRQSLLDESPDLEFEVSADIATVQAAIRQCGSLLRQHKHTFAGTDGIHIERAIVNKIVEWLLADDDNKNDGNKKNIAMLLDQAGMGKTVVMRSVLHRLEEKGVDVLAIKADQQLSTVTEIADIQNKLLLPNSVEQIVSRLAQIERVIILVDQIDALSLSLAHDQSTLNIILDLIARLQSLPNVCILVSCRLFDRNSDPRLKNIEIEPGASFSIPLLSPDEVADVLRELSIDETVLSQTTKELLRVPLHLDLFARVVSNHPNPGQLRGVASLQQLYQLIWDHVITQYPNNGPSVSERVEVIQRLTAYMDEHQLTTAPRSLLLTSETQHLERAVNWLASISILLASEEKWSFLHQTFFDYCYARQFVETGNDVVNSILTSAQGLFERTKLIQIIAYLRGTDFHRYLSDLQRLFNASELRYHLYDLLLRWFGSLIDPTDDEWIIARRMLQIEQTRQQLVQVISGNESWFDRAQPFFTDWLTRGSENQIELALIYFDSLIEKRQASVIGILRTFLGKSEQWDQRIATILLGLRQWQTVDAVELYEAILYKQTTLDRRTFWQIDEIAQAFPDAGCRILRYILDLTLAQHIERHSQNSNAPAMVSINVFDELRNLERVIEDTIKSVSQLEPRLFLEELLPWVIKVVTWNSGVIEDDRWFTADVLSHGWHSDVYRIQNALVHGLIEALTYIAQNDRDLFQVTIANLAQPPFETPQKLIAHVYCGLPELYAKDACEFLIEDRRRFQLGDQDYDSRQLMATIFPYLDHVWRQKLEKEILDYNPIYKYMRIYALEWRGLEQYRLLHAIPRDLLSPSGLKRYKEWQRKFIDYEITDSHNKVMVGTVGPPIERERANKMSDRNWLQAIRKYQGNIEHPAFLKGGARELASVLTEQIKENPERFYKLCQQLPDDIDDAYAVSFVKGFADSDAPLEWFCETIMRFAVQEEREIKRPVAWAVEKRVEEEIPNDILDLLLSWVQSTVGEYEERAEADLQHDLYHYYLNSDRGAAFSTVMKILDERATSDAREQKWQLIEFAASDSSSALRIGVIHELIYMIKHDRQRAWVLFEQLLNGYEHLLRSNYVREFLYWSMYKNYSNWYPYVEQMMHYPNEEIQERGAQLACIAGISHGAMESEQAYEQAQVLAEKAMGDPAIWRRGAAWIYTYNMTHGSSKRTRERCQEKVKQLIDDEDEGVREKIDGAFYTMRGEHFEELRGFIEEYALAELHPVDHQFTEYLWEHGMNDPEWTLTLVETLLHKEMQPEPWRQGGEELMRLVLNIYRSPLVDESVKEGAMDVFDELLKKHAGIGNKVLSEWDRR